MILRLVTENAHFSHMKSYLCEKERKLEGMVNLLVYHYTEGQREEINFQKLQIGTVESNETNKAIIFYKFHYSWLKNYKENLYLKLNVKKIYCL